MRVSGQAFKGAGSSLLQLECALGTQSTHTVLCVSSLTLWFSWKKGKAFLSFLIAPMAGSLSFPLDSSQKCCTALEFISPGEKHVEFTGHALHLPSKLPQIPFPVNPGVTLVMKP